MTSRSDEYVSLRQEIIEHQGRRESIVALIFTAVAVIFAAGVQAKNPLLLLSTLVLLFAGWAQIMQIHYGIQRLATYVRVMFEEDDPDLNWENASYLIRGYAIDNPTVMEQLDLEKLTSKGLGLIQEMGSLFDRGSLFFAVGIASVALALIISISLILTDHMSVSSQTTQTAIVSTEQYVYLVSSVLACIGWPIVWKEYTAKWESLNNMEIERVEAIFFENAPLKESAQATDINKKLVVEDGA